MTNSKRDDARNSVLDMWLTTTSLTGLEPFSVGAVLPVDGQVERERLLVLAERLAWHARVAEYELVQAARAEGATWAQIGEAYMVSGSAAQQRFRTRPRRFR